MLRTARSIASLISGTSLVLLGNGLLSTTVALRMEVEGFSSLAMGLILCAYYVGLTAGAVQVSGFLARIGHIRTFAAMAAASAASVLALSVAVHPATWILLRLIGGFTMAGIFVVVESWLNAIAPKGGRGTILAVYMVAIQIALALGSLLVALYDPAEIDPFLTTGLLHALGLVPIALTYIQQPPAPPFRRYGARALIRAAPVGVFGCLASGLASAALLSLGPLFTSAMGYSIEQTAVAMLVLCGSGLILQWPLGALSDRIGRRKVLAGACIALCAVALQIAWMGGRPVGLFLLSQGLVGALVFTIYPLSLAYANDLIEPDDMVAASGTLMVSFGLGAAIGPIAGSQAMGWFGAETLYIWVAAVAGGFAFLPIIRVITRRAIPKSRWVLFQAVGLPQAAPQGRLVSHERAASHAEGAEKPAESGA